MIRGGTWTATLLAALLGAGVAAAGPNPSDALRRAALNFANRDAIPRDLEPLLDGPHSPLDHGLFPPPSRSIPAEALDAASQASPDSPRGQFSSTSLPFRTFSTQPLLAEALELTRASLELREGSSAAHMLQLLGDVQARVRVAGNARRIGQLQERVRGLYDAAAPQHERAWPAIRHVVLAQTTRWLTQTGKTR